MREYVSQFAGQVLLCLFGWGVSLIPANTSWIPTIIIWSVALLWLIITLVFYRKYKEKAKLFDVLCPAKSISLAINRLDDGSYNAAAAGIGFSQLKILYRGELATITRLTMRPEIWFTLLEGKRWQTTNAIQLAPGSNPYAGPREQEFAWDNQNPQLWELEGLPLTMKKGEILKLPIIMVSVINGNEAGTRFDKGEECNLVIKLSMRTDQGSPQLPDQSISLTKSDIKDSLQKLGIKLEPEEGSQKQ